ncbi:HEPN domain-containing protein [Microbacterium sp.]|uniref:HEPN domain-containing protein n=1 Tax=Microbacterium sp. TaxID=51671 RepID=UPI00273560DC|nr:HEPN domain-containing protein [Microbacterium sp.]MDP3951732.1 HEPN domain-containing protein [Microbacterium sp.]
MTSAKGAHAVEAIYADYQALVDEVAASPSGLSAVNRIYNKHLLVAAASSLEDFVKDSVPAIFSRQGNERIGTFISKQVFVRGYHTLFDWKNQTAQPFFASFGVECATAFKAAVRADEELKTEHDAFMLLGLLRNEVVHNDFASKSIAHTPAEVIGKYRSGLLFVGRFENLVTLGS